jgi:hypothetical protein
VKAKASKPDAVARALDALRASAGRIRPWLLLAREEARDEAVCTRLQSVLDEPATTGKQPALPYGATMPHFIDEGCDSYREAEPGAKRELVVACGMALPTAEGRRFLRFAK